MGEVLESRCFMGVSRRSREEAGHGSRKMGESSEVHGGNGRVGEDEHDAGGARGAERLPARWRDSQTECLADVANPPAIAHYWLSPAG